ncbi:MAG: penicillin-binding protein 2 [Patescibacteria group bacterium]|nr:penicillin-binding protein 2 [Patescibacteria group bacterium]
MFKWRKKLSDFGEIEISDAVAHGGDHEKRKIEEPVGLVNIRRFLGVIMAAVAIIAVRTAYLQMARGAYYLREAEKNRVSKAVIKAPRGMIEDRRGEKLVENVASFDAVIVPAFLPDKRWEKEQFLKECFSLAGWKDDQVLKTLETMEEQAEPDSFKPVLVKENISREEAVAIELIQDKCPGFTTDKTAIREYVNPFVFAHILGYTGKVQKQDLEKDSDYLMTDSVGRTGVEEYWEKELKGEHGYNYVEVNSTGKVLRKLEEELPRTGSKLALGIDKGLQEKLYWELARFMEEKEGVRKAAAVMIDPGSGALRALVSFPSYNNNLFSKGIKKEDYERLINDPAKPLLNRVVGGEYAPGSTIKPVIGVAALQEGVVDSQTVFDCPGALVIGQWRFGDWKVHGANINLEKAIAQSCDVYFYTVGGGYGAQTGLGMQKMKQYEELFGLNQKTGVDLAGEQAGFIPTPEWKEENRGERWYIGNTYHASIGQGDLSVTPIQIANATAAIANGGILYKPHLVSEVINGQNGEVIKNFDGQVIRRDFVDRGYIEKVRSAMRQTVVSGTAQSLKELGHDICGKTGTAQIGGTENTHSWFVGFAPYDNPEIVIAVLVEEGGESTDAAVPVAKEVLKYYFER